MLGTTGGQYRPTPGDVNEPGINPAGIAGWATINWQFPCQATPRTELGPRLQILGHNGYREPGAGIDALCQAFLKGPSRLESDQIAPEKLA